MDRRGKRVGVKKPIRKLGRGEWEVSGGADLHHHHRQHRSAGFLRDFKKKKKEVRKRDFEEMCVPLTAVRWMTP